MCGGRTNTEEKINVFFLTNNIWFYSKIKIALVHHKLSFAKSATPRDVLEKLKHEVIANYQGTKYIGLFWG